MAAPATGSFNPNTAGNKLRQTQGGFTKMRVKAREHPKIDMERPRMRANIEKLGSLVPK